MKSSQRVSQKAVPFTAHGDAVTSIPEQYSKATRYPRLHTLADTQAAQGKRGTRNTHVRLPWPLVLSSKGPKQKCFLTLQYSRRRHLIPSNQLICCPRQQGHLCTGNNRIFTWAFFPFVCVNQSYLGAIQLAWTHMPWFHKKEMFPRYSKDISLILWWYQFYPYFTLHMINIFIYSLKINILWNILLHALTSRYTCVTNCPGCKSVPTRQGFILC